MVTSGLRREYYPHHLEWQARCRPPVEDSESITRGQETEDRKAANEQTPEKQKGHSIIE
jgi:hypothetical protein